MAQVGPDSLFVAIVACASEAILGIDRSGQIVIANPAAERMFGYEDGGLVNLPLASLIPEHLRAAHTRNHGEYFSNPRTRKMAEGKSLLAVRKDGSVFPVEVSLGYAESGQYPIAIAIVTDISELVRSRQQLQTLTQRLLAAEQVERRRCAMELHDGLSQRLAAISLRLSFLTPELSVEQAQQIQEVRKMAEQALEEVRVISHGMYPSLLSYSGLGPAVEHLIEELRGPGAPEMNDSIRLNRNDLPTAIANVVYRIAQESLHNALKHAQASHIHVGLEDRDGKLVLWVTDDGDGFDPAASSHSGSGLGLLSMRERALSVGGSFQILSEPGGGTRIKVELPLPQEGEFTVEDQSDVESIAEETSHS